MIPAVITHIFNPTAELANAYKNTNKEAKVEMETHPETTDTETSKYSI